jgi:hypothetical protein
VFTLNLPSWCQIVEFRIGQGRRNWLVLSFNRLADLYQTQAVEVGEKREKPSGLYVFCEKKLTKRRRTVSCQPTNHGIFENALLRVLSQVRRLAQQSELLKVRRRGFVHE